MAYKYIDLFCGAGGLSLGFDSAHFENIFAVEFNPRAVNVVDRTDASLRGGFGGRNARTIAVTQTCFKAHIVRE